MIQRDRYRRDSDRLTDRDEGRLRWRQIDIKEDRDGGRLRVSGTEEQETEESECNGIKEDDGTESIESTGECDKYRKKNARDKERKGREVCAVE